MPSLSKNWLLTKLDITKKTKSIWSSMEFGEFSTKGVNELGLLEVLYMPLDGEFSVPTVYSTLKIFRGIEKVQEIRVPDPACGILAVNVAVGDQVIQDLAVAAGPNIYIYRKLKPYFKFKLPVFEPQEEELAVWQRAKTGTLSVNELWTSLDQLKQRAVRLTSRSARFLQLPLTDLSDYYDRYREVTLESQTVATCMQTLYRQQASSDSVQCLIVGAEQNCLFVVDPTTFVLLATIATPAVPVCVIANGSYDIQYRIMVACRDGLVYQAKRGSDSVQRLFDPGSQIVGMIRADKTVIVGCMDQSVKAYSLKGHAIWTVRHNAPISSLIPVNLASQNISGYILSLTDGTLQLYKEQHVCDEILTWPQAPKMKKKITNKEDGDALPPSCTDWNPIEPDPVFVGVFGRYDRESGALAVMTRSGAVLLLLVKRSATFSPTGVIPTCAKQDRPLLEPPKRSAALSQSVQRERSNCIAITEQFSKDLSVMKRLVAKTYLELLEARMGPVSTDPTRWPITLNAQILGHGVRFKIVYDLTMTSSTSGPKTNLSIVHQFDDTVYRMEKPLIPLPFIWPQVKYRFTSPVEVIRDTSVSDTIRVLLISSGCPGVTILSLNVKAPICDPLAQSS